LKFMEREKNYKKRTEFWRGVERGAEGKDSV
jgi:hypothetical protein